MLPVLVTNIEKTAVSIHGLNMQIYHYTTTIQYMRTSHESKVWMKLRKESETDGLAAEVLV